MNLDHRRHSDVQDKVNIPGKVVAVACRDAVETDTHLEIFGNKVA